MNLIHTFYLSHGNGSILFFSFHVPDTEGVSDNGVVDSEKEKCEKEIEFLKTWSRDTREKFSLSFPIIVTSLEKTLSPSSSSSYSSSPAQSCGTGSTICGVEKKVVDWKEILGDEETNFQQDTSSLFPFDMDLNRRLGLLVQSIKSKTSRTDFLQCLRYGFGFR